MVKYVYEYWASNLPRGNGGGNLRTCLCKNIYIKMPLGIELIFYMVMVVYSWKSGRRGACSMVIISCQTVSAVY